MINEICVRFYKGNVKMKDTNQRGFCWENPIEDIKDSIIALSDQEDLMRKLLDLNFENERLKDIFQIDYTRIN